MSGGVLFITQFGDDGQAILKDLQQNLGLSVTLYVPDGAKIKGDGLPGVKICAHGPGALKVALPGHQLVLLGRFAQRGIDLSEVVDLVKGARIPLLSLHEDVRQLQSIRAENETLRRAGVGVILAGGMIPGVGAMMAQRLSSSGPKLTRLNTIYQRDGLGEGGGCYIRLQRGLRGLAADARGLREIAPLSFRRAHALKIGRGEVLLSVSSPEILDYIDTLPQVGAHLRLASPPLGALTWLSARLGEGPAKEASPWENAENGRLYGLRRALNRQMPRAWDGPAGGRIYVEAISAFRTRRLSFEFESARAATAAAVGSLVENMIEWRFKMGVHTPAKGLEADGFWQAMAKRGFDGPVASERPHRLQAREARRLHILAP